MKVTLLNGSPKKDGGNSGCFMSELKAMLGADCAIHETIVSRAADAEYDFASLYDCDAVVFFFPLYVDGIPSHVVRFLECSEQFLLSAGIKGIHVYGVVNSGFFEAQQNRTAIGMLRNWCVRSDLIWGQCAGIGGGEMLGHSIKSVPMGRGPKTSLGKVLTVLSENIRECGTGDTLFASPDFPRFLYIFAAHMGWRASVRQNGLKSKDLLRTPGLSG